MGCRAYGLFQEKILFEILASLFGGQFYWGVVKNRVKSGVRQTTYSETTVIGMENLIRYSETRENFVGSQFLSEFCLLNVFNVKLPVESGELAVLA